LYPFLKAKKCEPYENITPDKSKSGAHNEEDNGCSWLFLIT